MREFAGSSCVPSNDKDANAENAILRIKSLLSIRDGSERVAFAYRAQYRAIISRLAKYIDKNITTACNFFLFSTREEEMRQRVMFKYCAFYEY